MDFEFLHFILGEIQRADGVEMVAPLWERYQHHLTGCRLIYSHPEISSFIMPSRTWPRNFPKGGFLRPLFAYDNLYFLDDEIITRQNLFFEARIDIDSTLVFDTNVARHAEAFWEEKKLNDQEAIREIFDFLIGQKISFDYSFYALENARSYHSGGNISSIRRNVEYLLKLDLLDDDIYLKTGKPQAIVNDKEIGVRAEERIHQIYEGPGSRDFIEQSLRVYDLIYILLLKIVLIKFRLRDKPLGPKIRELYEFMHASLHTLFVREPMLALKYFSSKSALPFFRKIQLSRDDWIRELKGMAWDLMLFRHLERMTTAQGRGDYFIPHFLSFDKGLVDAFDLLSLKATFACGQMAQHYPLWKTDPQDLLRAAGVFSQAEEFFSPSASYIRNTARQDNPEIEHPALMEGLEREILSLR